MLEKILHFLVRVVVSIRYRVRVRGLENINPETLSKKGGILFLPNHPAEIDPVIVLLLLWGKYKAHPLVVEQFYYLKGTHSVQKKIGAVPIPDMSGVINRWKQKQVEKCLKSIADGLKNGSNYMIYPSGRLKLTGEEVIGGASFVHNLVQECPEANIVLIRTTGLWGSRFSKALTGATPVFGKVLWEGFKVVLKNLIFFTPKREVTLDIEPLPKDFPLNASRLEFNKALEKWYNINGPEPLKLVSDHFWNECYPKVIDGEKVAAAKPLSIAPEKEKEISDKIAKLAKRPSVSRSDHLAKDLGLDSLDLADLQSFLVVRYEIPSLNANELQTVEDVLRIAASPAPLQQVRRRKGNEWPSESSRPTPIPPQGATIHEAFLRACDRMGHHTACADERMGTLSYRRLKLIALTLSHHFKTFEEKQIGVLLPSTTISYAIVLGILLAGKVPVMLNWTVGSRALNHCKEMASLKRVISSRRFLEQLADGDLGDVDNLLLLLEDMRPSISLWCKLKAYFGAFRQAEYHLKDMPSEETAVILFTSGTEALPKGVPLTHHNILSNQTSGFSCITLLPTDSIYGALPPFHSFGFSVTGIFPLLIGLKVYYAPDPTQYYTMAHDVEQWKISILCSAPTFLKGLFQTAKPHQLKSARLIIAGAEKVPDEIFNHVSQMGAEMYEGYGITECSPVVTFTRPDLPREGVGTPIPGVELCVINSETQEKLPQGVDGEICVHGPNVFKGYLGKTPSPFIQIDGKKWYRSGDRGRMSPSGALILTGRLKRFVKIGGEMVSLSGIEEELLRCAHEKGWIRSSQEGPPLAIAVSQNNTDKPLIIVFSTFEVSKDTLNEALREGGFGRIVKISDVKVMKQIPVTGTGKTHYRALEEML
ncbi:MAG: AMP-binding protein [Rhabdochlamydiaceae bacterium]|jgi:long-chain-fatty-acid--[acyl-carrier-protein] ligase